MKTKPLLLALLLAVIVSSCIVKSLHPFYKPKDVIFKKELIGTWLDQESNKWTIKQTVHHPGGPIPGNPADSLQNNYSVSYTDKDGTSKFIVHLFQLNHQLYVDFYPDDVNVPDLTAFHLVKAHSIAKIGISKDSLSIKWFNEAWLADLLKNNKIRISHETIHKKYQDDSYILTASTDELQKFLIKYGNDPNAFVDNPGAKDKEEIMCYYLKRVQP